MEQQGATILFIDEEKSLCKSLTAFLLKKGFNVKYNYSLNELRSAIRDGERNFFVFDLTKPVHNVMDLMDSFFKIDPLNPIFIMTGSSEGEGPVRVTNVGASEELKQSSDLSELDVETIEQFRRNEQGYVLPEKKMIIEIGKHLRRIRKDKRLTLKDLSELTGLSLSLISKVEKGNSAASLATLYKLSNALKINISNLFSNEN